MESKALGDKKRIVILGGGFAGIRAALDLNNYLHDDTQIEITLVDRKNFQTYYVPLYKSAAKISFSDIFSRTKVKICSAYVDRVNFHTCEVVTDAQILPYDYLVMSLGSVADFYDIPNLDKFGFALKSLEDAAMIHNRVKEIVIKKDSARIIVGGAGFAGTEFSGELQSLLKSECELNHKSLDNFKILIVEGGTNFLPGLSEKASELIAKSLAHKMIETKFSSLITDVGKDFIVVNMKERVDCDLLVWTGGVRSVRLPVDAELEYDKKDRITTSELLNLKDFANVFVAGDNLSFLDPRTKKSVMQNSQEAIRQGSLVAKNIFRSISSKPLLPYSAGPIRFVIPLTGRFAVFYTPNLIIAGFWGWVIRRLSDLWYLGSILSWPKALKMFIKNK